jgi:PadR family transcriptional regulator PadR
MAHDPQMLKGVLSLLLLSVLREEAGYGYGIVTRLKAAGFEDLAEGTVYPALTRLESAGLLQSHLEPSSSGPARKYYRTTPAGAAELAARGRAWRSLVAAVDTVTGAAPPDTEGETA